MVDRVYNNVATSMAEGTQKILTLISDAIQSIGKEATEGAVAEIDSAWRKLASTHINGNPRHLRDYLEGIRPADIRNNKVQLRLSGYKAVQVEMGWAPPGQKGAAPADGLGTFDGQVHDMRPFLLHGSTGWEGQQGSATVETDKDGFAYKILRLPFEGAKHSDFTEATHEYLQARVQAKPESPDYVTAETASRATKRFKAHVGKMIAAARERSPDGDAALSDKAVKGIPKSGTAIFWSETMDSPHVIRHRNYLYKGLRATHGGKSKFTFHTLRTISDNPRQADLWKTAGIPPAGILQTSDGKPGPMVGEVGRILVERGLMKALNRKVNGKTVTVKG